MKICRRPTGSSQRERRRKTRRLTSFIRRWLMGDEKQYTGRKYPRHWRRAAMSAVSGKTNWRTSWVKSCAGKKMGRQFRRRGSRERDGTHQRIRDHSREHKLRGTLDDDGESGVVLRLVQVVDEEVNKSRGLGARGVKSVARPFAWREKVKETHGRGHEILPVVGHEEIEDDLQDLDLESSLSGLSLVEEETSEGRGGGSLQYENRQAWSARLLEIGIEPKVKERLALSMSEIRPRQTMACSRSSGTLLLSAGTTRSGTRPWRTELS